MQLSIGGLFPPLRISILGSGSGGNAVVVESGSHRLLLDAGFSCRELEKRLRRVGVEPKSLAAVLLTHEHDDHVCGAARFAGRHHLPIYATAGTIAATGLAAATAAELRPLASGRPVTVAGFEVEAFTIPHDAREPVGFIVRDGFGRKVGLASDLGSRSQLAWARLQGAHALILETNHDLEMLRSGPYPWVLKQRIASRHGHLSNRDAADGLPDLLGDRLRWVVLYHLSRTNNLPALAHAAVAAALERERCSAEVVLSDQFEPSPWLEVR